MHHAYDPGGNNSWGDRSVGNHWSDHNATNSDGNGMGNTAYYIEDISGARDRYPLVNMTETGAPKRIAEMNALICLWLKPF